MSTIAITEKKSEAALYDVEHWIRGAVYRGVSGRSLDIFNPATGSVQGKVRMASEADVDQAVIVASEAFVSWSEKSPLARARVLGKF